MDYVIHHENRVESIKKRIFLPLPLTLPQEKRGAGLTGSEKGEDKGMIRACLTDSRGLSQLLGSGYLQPTKAYLPKVSVVVHRVESERHILGSKNWTKCGPKNVGF